MDASDIAYHRRREMQERVAAATTFDPGVRRAHLALANLHARRRVGVEGSERESHIGRIAATRGEDRPTFWPSSAVPDDLRAPEPF